MAAPGGCISWSFVALLSSRFHCYGETENRVREHVECCAFERTSEWMKLSPQDGRNIKGPEIQSGGMGHALCLEL